MTGGINTYFTTTLIAIDGFLSLMNFKFWTPHVRRWVVCISILVVWLVAIGCGFAYAFRFYEGYREVHRQGLYADWTRCSPISWGLASSNHSDASNVYLATFWCGNVLVIALFLLCCAIGIRLFNIMQNVNRQRITTTNSDQEGQGQTSVHGLRRLSIVLVLVAIINVVSWIPPVFRHFIMRNYQSATVYTKSDAQFVSRCTLAGIIMQVHFVLDPIVYTLGSKRFCKCLCSARTSLSRICSRIKSKPRIGPDAAKCTIRQHQTTIGTMTTSMWKTATMKEVYSNAWALYSSDSETVHTTVTNE